MLDTIKLQRILIPVDFSPCCRAAFEYAAVLGRSFTSKLHLIHVVDERYVEKTAALFGNGYEEVARKLCLRARDDFAAFRAGAGFDDLVAEEVVTVGIPFQTIALKAQALPADLIVMGGHGRTGDGELDKIFFGSNAEKVVRLLPCPVLCVPEGSLQGRAAASRRDARPG